MLIGGYHSSGGGPGQKRVKLVIMLHVGHIHHEKLIHGLGPAVAPLLRKQRVRLIWRQNSRSILALSLVVLFEPFLLLIVFLHPNVVSRYIKTAPSHHYIVPSSDILSQSPPRCWLCPQLSYSNRFCFKSSSYNVIQLVVTSNLPHHIITQCQVASFCL